MYRAVWNGGFEKIPIKRETNNHKFRKKKKSIFQIKY